jgi:homopolymeric O-antigen transport system ATP-binding protein
MDAVVVSSVTKTYRVGVGRARVREMLPPPVDRLTRRMFERWWLKDTFNALEDVSLSITGGSSVGIVGHNGAGKTTLLKVIAGVTDPTSGRVHSTGRVSALLDVLVGLHPDLTGRENVGLFGAMHGVGRRAMNARLDRVIEFAEIGDMIDTPLKRCSAGMISRIGFGAVTALDPQVLLIDEVLAVGDAAFQRKCATWLQQYRDSGGTLIFVSHNLGLVRSMTERVVWLDHGKVMADGPAASILSEYGRAMERRDAPADTRVRTARGKAYNLMKSQGMNRWGVGGAHVEEVHVGEISDPDGALDVRIAFEVSEVAQAIFCVGFVDETGREIGAAASPALRISQSDGEVTCTIAPLPLRSGIYFPVVAILSEDGVVRDRWQLDRAVVIDRSGGELADGFGQVDIPSVWSANGAEVSDRE